MPASSTNTCLPEYGEGGEGLRIRVRLIHKHLLICGVWIADREQLLIKLERLPEETMLCLMLDDRK